MKKETLKQHQSRLDGEKWCRGVATSCDQSGMMWYCNGCIHTNGYHCDIPHEERIKTSVCAKNARKLQNREN